MVLFKNNVVRVLAPLDARCQTSFCGRGPAHRLINSQLSADFPDRKEGTIPRREFTICDATSAVSRDRLLSDGASGCHAMGFIEAPDATNAAAPVL
jgi:hypothetical protein